MLQLLKLLLYVGGAIFWISIILFVGIMIGQEWSEKHGS